MALIEDRPGHLKKKPGQDWKSTSTCTWRGHECYVLLQATEEGEASVSLLAREKKGGDARGSALSMNKWLVIFR
jgi:hypothetical protein